MKTRENNIYGESKKVLDEYYKNEFSLDKPMREIVWEKNGYDKME